MCMDAIHCSCVYMFRECCVYCICYTVLHVALIQKKTYINTDVGLKYTVLNSNCCITIGHVGCLV